MVNMSNTLVHWLCSSLFSECCLVGFYGRWTRRLSSRTLPCSSWQGWCSVTSDITLAPSDSLRWSLRNWIRTWFCSSSFLFSSSNRVSFLLMLGFNCDWYVFRKAIVNILILAAPGVLWGAILLGCCFKLLLGYEDSELSWYQAFTLGCVLSATDPVAVVALLKDLGASVRFNTLI